MRLVDSAAYDVLTVPNDFTRGNPASQPPLAGSPGNSIQRLPNGADTGNNSADFAPSLKHTPGVANM